MLLIINHKANFELPHIIKYEKEIRKMNCIILPSSCYLSIFQKGKYTLGSQDISQFDDVTKTGEIIGKELKSLNVKYSLVGHSERRLYNKESDEVILNKLNNCYKNNIIPLYCIGETVKGDYDSLKSQIDLFVKNFSDKHLILIYEPIYNIGNKNPELDKLEDKIKFIKEYLFKTYNKNYKLIYGGGVNKDSIDIIKNIKDIDGLIISSESLDIKNLRILYKKIKE